LPKLLDQRKLLREDGGNRGHGVKDSMVTFPLTPIASADRSHSLLRGAYVNVNLHLHLHVNDS
jgi:hypothetical protein